jgi:hypothetical protein
VAVKSNLQATLKQGQSTSLFVARFEKCLLTLTAETGEFTTIPFQTRTFGGLVVSDFFEASQVGLSFGRTIPFARILATTPQGVGTLDIVYEVRTRGDA